MQISSAFEIQKSKMKQFGVNRKMLLLRTPIRNGVVFFGCLASMILSHIYIVAMIIKGFEHIQHSPVLCKLLNVGKDWMSIVSKAADEVEAEERTMRILPKEIGRHAGFVVKIYSTDGADMTTFYAKTQSVSVTTFLIHVLLKNIQCGPDAFHIPLLDMPDGFFLGVITRKVKDWSMASTLSRAEQIAFLDEQDRLLSTSFLLNILNELGRFGNIPNNKENWGFVDCFDNSVAYSQMALIDFSRGGGAKRSVFSKTGQTA